MKIIYVFLLLLFISTQSIAQVTPGQTMTLAIKYYRGETGNYPQSLFVSGITSEDDTKTIWGIKPSALFEGARGEVRVYSSDGHKVTVIIKEYATLEEAALDRDEMIAAMKKMYPAIEAQPSGTNTDVNLVDEQAFGDETHGVFAALMLIYKQPGAGADKQYKLQVLL